jgi:hypothetical protein
MKTGLLRAILAGISLFLAHPAEAIPDASGPTIVISRDNGGNLVEYARMVTRARNANTFVRFQGQCASSCTLFLSLRSSQTCISRGASFVFHRAYGAQEDFNQWGTEYLIERYPDWVRRWINANGGLTSRLIRMDYAYASQFLRPCGRA